MERTPSTATTDQLREELRTAAARRGDAEPPAPRDRLATMRAVRAGLDKMVTEDGPTGAVRAALISAASLAGAILEEVDFHRSGGARNMEDVEQMAGAAPQLPAPMPGRSVLQQLSKREIEELDMETRLQLEEENREVIARAEAERGKRRAEIAAAVALQPIEPDPDENLHPGLVKSLEAEAEGAFRDARAVMGPALDAERRAARSAGGGLAGYVASLRAHTTRWRAIAALTPAEAALLAGAVGHVAVPTIDPSMKLMNAQRQAGITAPGFNAHALIAQLSGRGIALAVRGGELVASPAGMLDQAAREQLRQHRAAVIEALQSSEII